MSLQDNGNSSKGMTPELIFQIVQPHVRLSSSSTPRPRTSVSTAAVMTTSAINSERRKSTSATSKERAGQSSCMGIISSFPIIQETPRKSKSKLQSTETVVTGGGSDGTNPPTPVPQPFRAQPTLDQKSHHQRPRSSELRIKMESVGTQLEEDDDLDTCPARTRSVWPREITPWWKPNHPYEKPAYSYAALIAYAILSSKDGRLTLSDIYKWISTQYPCFVLGQHNWQNSIRHNLSLNKNKFLKIDRRPTQANPGKGSYWTLVPGSEESFIAQLTQACSHSRKHHDIGLTAELSIAANRRGSFYANRSADDSSTGSTTLSHGNMLITRPEDYETHKKPSPSSSATRSTTTATTTTTTTTATATCSNGMQGMYTTFRMSSTSSAAVAEMDDKNAKRENGSFHKQRTNKKRRPQQQQKQQKQQQKDHMGAISILAGDNSNRNSGSGSSDAEYDSGVDVDVSANGLYLKKEQDDMMTSSAVDSIFGGDFSWQDSLLDVAVPLANLDINDSTLLSCYLSQQQQQDPVSLNLPMDDNDWSLPVDAASNWFQTGTMSTPAYITSSSAHTQPLLDHNASVGQWDQQHRWTNGLAAHSGSCAPASQDHFVLDGNNIQPSLSYPTLLASKYEPPQQQNTMTLNPRGNDSTELATNITETKVEDCLKELVSFQQRLQQQQHQLEKPKQNPIIINLEDEVTNQYLHFEDTCDDDEEEDINNDDQEADQAPSSLCPDDTPSSVLKEYNSSISMSDFLSHL